MELAIIGGGASGMMAAIQASRYSEHVHVAVYDAAGSLGTKILATGNGHCNFTNLDMNSDRFNSNRPSFVKNPLNTFSERDAIEFFASIGAPGREKNGYMYPVSDQAATIQEALIRELERKHVKIHSNSHVIQIQYNPDGTFTLELDSGYQSTVDTVVLACGSYSMPSSGCDGSGYGLAEAFGHRIIPVIPALTSLICEDEFCPALHGTRVRGSVTLYLGDKAIRSEQGEVQLVKNGISGIPVFQLCRHAGRILETGAKPVIRLDAWADSDDTMVEMFRHLRQTTPEMTLRQFLHGYFPDRLTSVYLRIMDISHGESLAQISEDQWNRLLSLIHGLSFHVIAAGDIRQAQACAGGVDVDQVDENTLGSRIVPGLYFAGEMLDVDGICGGYNLQWAWTSGYLAGRAAAEYSEGISEITFHAIRRTAVVQTSAGEDSIPDKNRKRKKNTKNQQIKRNRQKHRT